MNNSVNMRELALEALLEIGREGRQCHTVIRQVLEKYQYLPRQDRAFFKRLCEGTLERRITLDYIIDCFSKVKTRRMKPVLREILRMAVYQMKYMDGVPDSAAVNEAVKLARKKGFHGLTGFVNGVLRAVLREGGQISWPEEDAVRSLSVRYSMPEYLVEKWLGQLNAGELPAPEGEASGTCTQRTVREGAYALTERVCQGLLAEAPLTVRVRQTDNTVPETLESLRSQGVTAEPAPYLDYAFYLSGYGRLDELKAFQEGRIQVQDVSSMLAVEAAGIRPGDFVLDLCAAPGGKSLLAADKAGKEGRVAARDLTLHKVEMLRENIARSGLGNITAEQADAAKPDPSMKERADVVLADLPCSGYGVIGRKTDIKYRASRESEEELVRLQRRILTQAALYVKPGGILLYSTCTICREENQENVKWFRENFPFRPDDLRPFLCEELCGGTAAEGYLQLLPGLHQCDGFFLARLKKEG